MSAIDATDVAVGLLRVMIGVVFVLHGWHHAFGGGRLAGTARWFESLGMRPGHLHASMASLTEFGGGLLLAMGLLTPLAAALLGTMVVANHMRNGFFIGGSGGGRLGVDRVLGIFGAGWLFLALTVGLGIVGSLAQLLFFWRPSPVASH